MSAIAKAVTSPHSASPPELRTKRIKDGKSLRISISLLFACRLVAEGQEPLAAIALPRLHHQLLPETVFAEQWSTPSASFDVAENVLEALKQRGHSVVSTDTGAVCQVVAVDPDTGTLTAASDPRKDGAPSGY